MKTKEKILFLLEAYIETYPNQRITQALFNLDVNSPDIEGLMPAFKDNFHDTDKDVLRRMKNAIKKSFPKLDNFLKAIK